MVADIAENPRLHWLGEQSGERSAEILLGSRLLVVSSLLDDSANVVSEAIVSDIPVLGTDIPCMQGRLGDDYPGPFSGGDAHRLAQFLRQAETDCSYDEELSAWCRRESYKFAPERERECLKILVERVFSCDRPACQEVSEQIQQK